MNELVFISKWEHDYRKRLEKSCFWLMLAWSVRMNEKYSQYISEVIWKNLPLPRSYNTWYALDPIYVKTFVSLFLIYKISNIMWKLKNKPFNHDWFFIDIPWSSITPNDPSPVEVTYLD
jgi:hypothetical protein